VENNIDKITDESEKNPNKALIRSYLLAIASLVSVILYFNNRLNSKDEEKIAAVQFQRDADAKSIELWQGKFDAMSKKYDDCNTLVLTRTDANAIRDQQKLDYYEESLKRSIASRKKNAAGIQKIAETIPTIKTPVTNQTNQTNEN
jgi:transketolase